MKSLTVMVVISMPNNGKFGCSHGNQNPWTKLAVTVSLIVQKSVNATGNPGLKGNKGSLVDKSFYK